MPDQPSTPPRRQPCAFCGEPNRWPDRCADDLDLVCAEIIGDKCEEGDHRRCVPETCAFSSEIHREVIAAGIAAAVATGHRWAVVSILESDDPLIVGTGDHLGRAKSLLRSGHIKRSGAEVGPLTKGFVYVVSADGWLY